MRDAGPWTSVPALVIPAFFLLLRQRADVVHHVPDVVILGAVAFGRHVVALALADDVEKFAVGAIFQGVRIGEVGDVFHIRRHVALAVAVFSMAHRAVVAIQLFGLGGSFRGDFVFGDGRFGLRQ